MHISHDFIATKTCPSLEFLVVFGQVRVWDRKSPGRGGLGWSAGLVRAKFLKLLRVRGGFKFCGCGHKISTRAGHYWLYWHVNFPVFLFV